jgi:sterol desaturase/sphingolipid hydroxylase (fatty acid hydroxylase superfamily)
MPRPERAAIKKTVFKYFQPAAVAAIVVFWALAPAAWVKSTWLIVVASSLTTAMVQALEFVNERHAGWRMNKREFFTDLFYVVLSATVIAKAVKVFSEEPLKAAKHALGISTPWLMHMPFILQVALVVFLIEFGQYWMHRLMHNSPVWWTHAPHHHITQLNAAKGAVGNPLELFLVSLSVVALFDFKPVAVLCAANVLTAVSSFAHANVRFDPPRWYSFFFTTIEHHSLHHSVTYEDTRCNYANSLILIDRVLGTFRAGESAIVGQDDRRRLSIWEQFIFPAKPLIALIKARRELAPAAAE